MAEKLNILFEQQTVKKWIGNPELTVDVLFFDSRTKVENGLFFAIEGTAVDGHAYIDQAIENGAIAVVCRVLPKKMNPKVSYVQVDDTSAAMGVSASAFYGHPSQALNLVGITGTNGKTTTVTLLHQLFTQLGYHVGLLSTILNKVGNEEINATHTTPDAIALNQLLRKMVDAGCSHAFMEVSSHAVVQKRIAGLHFTGAVFSNITHDHLDFHGTFDEYIKAKKRFFDELNSDAFALTNMDDKNGLVMLQNTKAKKHTYGLKSFADFKCKIIENDLNGLHLMLDQQEIWCRLVGEFNAYNLTTVYAIACLLGEEKQEVLTILSNMKSVEGRFDTLESADHIFAVVDYAHTPDALKNVLKTMQEVRQGNESLITVVGCGGDRDKSKRPKMARIAYDLSDKLILTSDNPRSEDPESILDEMFAGLDVHEQKRALRMTSREEAIKMACMLAKSGDMILVAGKGHEKYQEIKGERSHFDDKEILRKYLTINND